MTGASETSDSANVKRKAALGRGWGVAIVINWIFFPKSVRPPAIVTEVVACFERHAENINSEMHELESNAVLAEVASSLARVGFLVETGKKAAEKITVPVLFGPGGRPEKSFDADGYHEGAKMVLEIEAGRAVVNNQFLKDLFQACMMQDVLLLGIAVRNRYRTSNDYDRVVTFFETLYASSRLQLPLDGILVLGY